MSPAGGLYCARVVGYLGLVAAPSGIRALPAKSYLLAFWPSAIRVLLLRMGSGFFFVAEDLVVSFFSTPPLFPSVSTTPSPFCRLPQKLFPSVVLVLLLPPC